MSELIGKLTVPTEATATLIDKNISSNGTYNASEDSADGYKKVVVAVPLGTKSITDNGTYNASSDNLEGFSSVTVNVSADVKNPNYNWFTNEDETLIVRQNILTGAFRWYFKDFVVTDELYMPVPQNLLRFALNSVGAYCYCNDYEEDYNGVIGFYDNTIRLWSVGLGYNMAGTVNKGIIESTDSEFENIHTWEEPTFDPING